MEPLTPDDLQTFLTENNIPAEIVHLDVHTPTVPAAAEAIGVVADQIVKTVVFLIDGQPHAVFANGVRRVDTRKLATRFGVNRKKVKLADGETVLQITGYAPGTVPPVGHRQKIPMLMETDVQTHEIVYAGGGGIADLLRIRSADLLAVTQAELLDVLEAPESDSSLS